MTAVVVCWLWVSCVVAAGIIGLARNAALPGALLGLFLGPVGVFAAFALDGRSSCPHCAGRLDGRGQICQHCNRPIRWQETASESSSILSRNWLPWGHDALACPYCATPLDEEVSRCPKCSGGITWAKGTPLRVSRHDGPEMPEPQPTEKAWSQSRRLR